MEQTASFGYWLRRRRKALDLTQDALARQAGCALGTLKKIETDERRPSHQLAERLADCLAIPAAERAAFVKAARAELATDQLTVIAQPIEQNDANPALSGSIVRPNNLPAQPTALIGREHEIAAVVALLRGDDLRLLTLTGPGGTGKTRLAMQAAAELLATFADGIWFVNLAPIRDPALVLPTIAQSLGVIELGDQPIKEHLKAYLRAKHLLLLLDNFEQVIDAAPQIAELLSAAPGMKALVTSRATLHIYGEHQYFVPPLALPPQESENRRTGEPENHGRRTTDDGQRTMVTQYESVRLFIARARAAKADFVVTNDSAPAVAEICHRLDGLPLAIELAAARIKLFAPEALLARLSQPLALLVGGPRDLSTRQQTLRNTIEWSYELLDESEQALFRRLGAFVGGWTLEAAEAVYGDWRLEIGDNQSQSLISNLQSLLDKSLLHQEAGPDGEPRFMMLETVREYALEWMEDGNEAEAVQRQHAEYYLKLAETAGSHLHGPAQRVWLARLEMEHDNMRAVLAWSEVARKNKNIGLRLATALGEFWEMRGHRYQGCIWLSNMLTHTREPTLLRAKALNTAGLLSLDADTIGAHTLFEESFAIAHALGDKKCLADALLGLGWSGNDAGVRQNHVVASLTLYQDLNDKAGRAKALGLLAAVTKSPGDLQQALTLAEESLALYRELEDQLGCAWSLETVGRITREQGDAKRAAAYLQESLALCRELGNQAGEVGSLLALADVAQLQGDYGRAEDVLNEALALSQKLGDRSSSAWALNNLGDLILYCGDTTRARQIFTESIALFGALGATDGISQCLLGFAGVAAATGQAQRATRLCSAVEALVESLGESFESSLPADDRAHYDRTLAAIRIQLDDATFAAAWAAGRALTLDEAIAEALEVSPINDGSASDAKESSM